jgi:hypothetical protein
MMDQGKTMTRRNINDLPQELLSNILLLATKANQNENETFTYGLTNTTLPLLPPKLNRYVRGPVTAESLRWDATRSIRQVSSRWHTWALSYNLEHVFERKSPGSERWAELSLNRRKYSLYELINSYSGQPVFQDPINSLRKTDKVFHNLPHLTKHVRRLWFNGFHTAETDKHILSIVSECDHLQFLSVPWTVLRRSTAEDWIDLLNVNTGHGCALKSLEIQAVCLPKSQALALEQETNPSNPLASPLVTFSSLKRLKIFGNTLHNPITDTDLSLIAKTATNLTALDITNISTISVAGVLKLIKSSQKTLQVLEHSPRSDDGFYHPFPGNLPDNEHICTLLSNLPKMRDLSISIPTLCTSLFQNENINWEGEFQVRATDLCGCKSSTTGPERASQLGAILSQAKNVIEARTRLRKVLAMEVFFAGCIFEVGKGLVHGDFCVGEVRRGGKGLRAW